VYCLRSHNMLGWPVCMVWWIYFDCMDEIFCALAYPTFFVVWSVVWNSLLRWSSTCWCEQMRGTPVGNRVVEILLHSPRGLVYNSLRVSLGLWPMYLLILRFIYFWLNSLFCFLLDIVLCLGIVRSWVFKLPDCACMLYLCDATFNFAY